MTTRSVTRAESPARPSILRRIWRAIEVRRQRDDLSKLDDRALADIGVTRHEANKEANRPVWDLTQLR